MAENVESPAVDTDGCCSQCDLPLSRGGLVTKAYARLGQRTFCCYGCSVVYEFLHGLHAPAQDLASRNRRRRNPFARSGA